MNAPVRARPIAAQATRPLAPSLERRRVRLYLAIVLLDVALLLGAFGTVGTLYQARIGARSVLAEGQLLLPLYLTLALYQQAYSIRALDDWWFAAWRALSALAIAAALLIFVTFFTKSTASFSRVLFTGGMVLTALLIVASRRAIVAWVRRNWGPGVSNLLFIEAGGPDVPLPGAIRIDALAHGLKPDPSDPAALDLVGRYLLNMDRVVVSCPAETRNAWAHVLRAAGVRGEVVSDRLNDLAPIGLVVEDGWRSLIVSTGPLGLRQRAVKRGFDAAVALAGLAILSPVMLLTALAIKLSDGGPVFFVQRRLGRGNRFFNMVKFRSMRAGDSDHAGARSAAREDDRVTPVGRLIRRTSIDELPQLFNVLKGDMSVVGPRPHALGSQAGAKLFWEVDGAYWSRHSLKPGLTGLAQIRGLRGATDAEADLTDRLGADLEYIRHWNIWRDAWIVLQTVRVLVHPRAY
jgi:lipopolysaccharide/colanic/teichoic acid biosynthesis glycosyltransferase